MRFHPGLAMGEFYPVFNDRMLRWISELP
jgi:hypothetical protein